MSPEDNLGYPDTVEHSAEMAYCVFMALMLSLGAPYVDLIDYLDALYLVAEERLQIYWEEPGAWANFISRTGRLEKPAWLYRWDFVKMYDSGQHRDQMRVQAPDLRGVLAKAKTLARSRNTSFDESVPILTAEDFLYAATEAGGEVGRALLSSGIKLAQLKKATTIPSSG